MTVPATAPIDHLAVRSEAVRQLGKALREGTLTLFLGAGTSSGAGLPSWPNLIRRMAASQGLSLSVSDDASAETLQRAADRIRAHVAAKPRRFTRIVSEALYDGVALRQNLLHRDLIIAIGALLAGSRRGSVNRVVTLNYDSTLEWYLSVLGLVTRIVRQPLALEGAEDVRIYHPHGFLAHPSMHLEDSDFVILGFESVNERIGTPGEPWFELMRHTLSTSTCLFVGLSFRSFEDRALAPLLAAVAKNLAESGIDRPIGYWLCPDPSFEAEPVCDREQMRKSFLTARIAPLFWADEAEVPALLFEVCQRHATLLVE